MSADPKNSNLILSNVDTAQVLRYAFDDATGALRTVPAKASVMSIELDVKDGDTVGIQGISQSISGNSSQGIIGPVDCSGMKSFQLYAKTNRAAATGAIDVTLQLSPVSAGDIWYSTPISLTLISLPKDEVVASLPYEGLAKRARIKATKDSDLDIFLLMQGN